MNKTPRLIDLVIAKLQEQYHAGSMKPHVVTSVYRSGGVSPQDDYWDFYLDNTYIGEVCGSEVAMLLRNKDKYEHVTYHASDPNFFTDIIRAANSIMDYHKRTVEDGLDRAQYFNL